MIYGIVFYQLFLKSVDSYALKVIMQQITKNIFDEFSFEYTSYEIRFSVLPKLMYEIWASMGSDIPT